MTVAMGYYNLTTTQGLYWCQIYTEPGASARIRGAPEYPTHGPQRVVRLVHGRRAS